MTSDQKEKRGKPNPLKTKLLIAAMFLLILALGFNAMLSSSSLEKLYVESLLSSYQVIGKDFQRKLEMALRFGKNIKKFIGITPLMNNVLRYMEQQETGEESGAFTLNGSIPKIDRYVAVSLPDGKILYSTDKKLVGTVMPESARYKYGDTPGAKGAKEESQFLKHQSTYLVMLPIHDRRKNWVATAVLGFEEKQVKDLLNSALLQNIQIAAIDLSIGAILILISLFLILPRERARINQAIESKTLFVLKKIKYEFPKRKISMALFIVIILCQVVFSTSSTNAFKNYYLKITKEKSLTLTTVLKEDIEYLLSKGLHLNRLFKMEVMMGKVLEALPEVSDITIMSRYQKPLYMANKQGVINFTKEAADQQSTAPQIPTHTGEYNVRINIIEGDQIVGFISTNISKHFVKSKLLETIYDSLTVLVISVFFFVELLILVFQFLEKQAFDVVGKIRVQPRSIRPAAFLFLFGTDLSISFLPLHMEKLYEPIFGLSKNMVMGLPISVEMFFALISLFLAGIWIDRRGWHQPFLGGLFLQGLGILYSWQAPNAIHFIISRGFAGLGYGFALMATQGFVMEFADSRKRAQGLAQLFAGVYAGSICGGVAGAMLAERIGYQPVFLIGAMILFSIIAYTFLFMRNAIQTTKPHFTEAPVKVAKTGGSLHFLFNRNVFTMIIFSSIPGAIAIVGFLNYFSPIYLKQIGAAQATIGRVLMIYGVCLIYLAPIISKYVDASENKKLYITVSGILGALAFVTFYSFSGIAAAAMAIFLLGLSSSFGMASQSAYILKLKVTQDLGTGKAMGIFRSATRFGQVLGPMVFGWIMVTMEINRGIFYFALAYLSIVILFIFLAQIDTRTAATED